MRDMAWIELCVDHNFVMPIADYTLDGESILLFVKRI